MTGADIRTGDEEKGWWQDLDEAVLTAMTEGYATYSREARSQQK